MFETAVRAGVFEDQRGVDGITRRDGWSHRRQVGDDDVEPGQRCEPLGGGTCVVRVDVDADHPPRDRAIDVFQPIATGDAKNRDRRWLDVTEHVSKQIGQHAKLLDARRAHVPFVVGQPEHPATRCASQ